VRQFEVKKYGDEPFSVHADEVVCETYQNAGYAACSAKFFRLESTPGYCCCETPGVAAVTRLVQVAFVNSPTYVREVTPEGEVPEGEAPAERAPRFDAAVAADGTVIRISEASVSTPGWVFEKQDDWYTPQIELCYSDKSIQRLADKYGFTLLWPVTA
jgi:hypothetical protein